MLFNSILWKWLCRKKHLVTLCSENFKHTLCSRQGAALYGRRKLYTLVLDRPDILSLWDLEGLLLSEVVFPNSVGGKVQQADPRSQAHWEFSSLTSAHLLWLHSFILVPSLCTVNFTSAYPINSTADFIPFSNITPTTCNLRNPFLGLPNKQCVSAYK